MSREPPKPPSARTALLALALLAAMPVAAQLPVQPSDRLAASSQQPLPLAKAFPWHVSEAAPGQVRVIFAPAPEHYLYQHAFAFRLQSGGQELPLEFELPPGKARNDAFFGDVIAHYDQVTVTLQLGAELAPGAALVIEFQGCADWGFCYPPQQERFVLPKRNSGKSPHLG